MNDVICPNCQTPNRPTARFCANCGRNLNDNPFTTTLVIDEATLPTPSAVQPTVPVRELRLPDVAPQPEASDEGSPTVPLSRHPEREPLPEGTLLAGRFLIRNHLSDSPPIFAYMAEDTGEAPYGLGCILRESIGEAPLAGELAAWSRVAPGPGVRPPYDAFALTIPAEGARRVFVVRGFGEPFGEPDGPHDPATTLAQGAALARGLSAVHAAGLAFGAFDGGHIHRNGETLYLADFEASGPGTPAAYDRDVRALATLINRMLGGKDGPASGEYLSMELLAALTNGSSTLSAAELATALENDVRDRSRPGSYELRTGRRTDPGQVRLLNEDSLLVLDVVWNNRSVSRPLGLYVVADGMGGHESGEVASGLLVNAIARHAAELLPRAAAGETFDAAAWLEAAVQAGNVEVFERSQADSTDMGTTIVAALVNGDQATIGHVGDSRAYLINAAGIRQLTVDHSLVESMVAANQITREEARNHPQSNVIYRTIGDKRRVSVDLDRVSLAVGDALLLCSDGLSGMITDDMIHRLVMSAASPQAACEALVSAANQFGGEDNITVIIARLERAE